MWKSKWIFRYNYLDFDKTQKKPEREDIQYGCDINPDSNHSWQANFMTDFLDKPKYDLRTFLILDFLQPLLMCYPGIEVEAIFHWLNK